uniref:Ig-like domain-containing protein n=1 Tax=Salmo trutta TaxID=8032 RepID=A0A673XGR9_SALTR
ISKPATIMEYSVQSAAIEASSWTAEVPVSVSCLQGSCIVIPCSFNYPEPENKPSEFTGIWFKDTYEVSYHTDSSNITDYRGRTELVGNLRQKNCSLRIDPLHRMEAHCYNCCHLFLILGSPDPPSLSVMEEVKVGEVVSVSCSVSHSCPSDPPLLTWSHSGTPSIQSQQQTNSQWEEKLTLTFRPSIADNNQPLVCTAAYKGGMTVSSSKTINVKCPNKPLPINLPIFIYLFVVTFVVRMGPKRSGNVNTHLLYYEENQNKHLYKNNDEKQSCKAHKAMRNSCLQLKVNPIN